MVRKIGKLLLNGGLVAIPLRSTLPFIICFAKYLNFGKIKTDNEFREILECFLKTEKFEFSAKQIIYLECPDHPLQKNIV